MVREKYCTIFLSIRELKLFMQQDCFLFTMQVISSVVIRIPYFNKKKKFSSNWNSFGIFIVIRLSFKTLLFKWLYVLERNPIYLFLVMAFPIHIVQLMRNPFSHFLHFSHSSQVWNNARLANLLSFETLLLLLAIRHGLFSIIPRGCHFLDFLFFSSAMK